MDFALNALGFILLVAVFLVFRGWVRGRRRRAYEHFQRAMNPPAVPVTCRHCGTPVAAGAAFCPRCGATLPPPLPAAPPAPEDRRRKAIVYVVIGVLAVLGLAALKSARRAPQAEPSYGPSRFQRHLP